jgi:chemotaxis protein methyltransferase CheR
MSEETAASIELRLLLDGIFARYGYDLRGYAKASMQRRVDAALEAMNARHLGELQHRVLHDRECFSTLLEHVTVRVSELFRDPTFFLEFRARVVPVLRTYPFLKIWHAGCAGGQEAYSGAILLTEEGLLERTQIYATDISARALAQAREGAYTLPSPALAKLEKNYRDTGGSNELTRYLTVALDQVALRPALRRKISFFQHDLVTDHVFGEMNVVFCKNVLIYFGRELRERVLQKIAASLCPGGFLCLGSSERLTGASPIEAVFTPFASNQRIYRYEP